MKRILITLLAGFMCMTSHAQFIHRNQIGMYVSVGNAVTEMYWNDKIEELSKLGEYTDDIHCGAPIHFLGWGVEYYFKRDSKWNFGISSGMEISRYEHCYSILSNENNILTEKYHIQPTETNMFAEKHYIHVKLWYVIPTIRYNWLKRNNLRCYSSASIGVAQISYDYDDKLFEKDDDSDSERFYFGDQIGDTKQRTEHSTALAYQAVPFGCEIGSNWFNYFIELGYGYKGKVITGIRFSF